MTKNPNGFLPFSPLHKKLLDPQFSRQRKALLAGAGVIAIALLSLVSVSSDQYLETRVLSPSARRRPDLISTINVSSTGIVVGQSLTVTGTVKNIGNATAKASTTRFDLMNNLGVLGSVSTPSLAAGASVTLTKTWTATTGGTYWFRVCADQPSVVAESNETNNCSGPSSNVIVLWPQTPSPSPSPSSWPSPSPSSSPTPYPPHSPSPSPSYFPSPNPSWLPSPEERDALVRADIDNMWLLAQKAYAATEPYNTYVNWFTNPAVYADFLDLKYHLQAMGSQVSLGVPTTTAFCVSATLTVGSYCSDSTGLKTTSRCVMTSC